MTAASRPAGTARWTLDQLAERVDAALSVDYDGQASGRVRDVPDRRAIRWYTTLGLVDRPAAMRGRTALYGRRHLLQLVAIKRLQAGGLSLAGIQARLAAATDEQLERVARLPDLDERATRADPALDAAPPAAPRAAAPLRVERAFWKRTVAGTPSTAAADPATPLPAPELAGAAAEGDLAAEGDVVASPVPEYRASPAAVILQGVRLDDGVTLLLDHARPLRRDEVRAIQAAARPLLDALGRGRKR